MKHCFAGVCALLLGGCVSMVFGGGSLAKKNYQADFVVNYRAEGTVPPSVTYHLVRTKKGEAMFERSPDGSGTLFETHWRDGGHDHYAAWLKRGAAYHFTVPVNRSLPAKRFFYVRGAYRLEKIDGVKRPVPTYAAEPVATLYPK